MIKNYELTLLVRSDASSDDVKTALQGLSDIISDGSGTVLYTEYWGLRQLEYKIGKSDYAHFYMIQFSASKEVNTLLEERLKSGSLFLRYLLINADDDGLKMKSPNCLTGTEQSGDGVVFDKRFFSAMTSVFDVK